MKKTYIVGLSIMGFLFLVLSFPIKYTLDNEFAADICRALGFILVFIVIGIKAYQKK